MECIRRDVVHRAAPRLVEVPAGVDGHAAGRVEPLGLVRLVVALEGTAADRPGDVPDRTLANQLPGAADLRSEDLAWRRDEPQGTGARKLDQRVRLFHCRRHRLVDVDVLAG